MLKRFAAFVFAAGITTTVVISANPASAAPHEVCNRGGLIQLVHNEGQDPSFIAPGRFEVGPMNLHFNTDGTVDFKGLPPAFDGYACGTMH